jgi:hypothetical protein
VESDFILRFLKVFQVKRQVTASQSEDVVRQYALRRLAEVFCVPESELPNEARFGYELRAVPASCFKLNEFDLIDSDIKDVADRRLLKEMSRGELVIRTVGEYCEHMVKCYLIKPKEVAQVLRLPVNDGVLTSRF